MFSKIIETRSKTIIPDILGVATVDSAVANRILKITKGCKLLGCDAIISRISAEIAKPWSIWMLIWERLSPQPL